MRGVVYMLALILALLLAWCYLHGWYFGLAHDADRINFWVAFGTIALATATVFSVLETQAILSQEDIRHQESYARIVTLELHENYPYIDGFYVRNGGLGPAVRLKLEYKAIKDVYAPPLMGVETRNGSEPVSAQINLDDVIKAPGSRTIRIGAPIHKDRISFTTAKISYLDVFGNEYSTVYEDFASGKFKWAPIHKIRSR